MPCLRVFSAVVLTLLVLSGCSPSGSSATRRVAAKLNSGGTYYMIADKTFLPAQLHFLLARLRPIVDPLLEKTEIPVSYDQILSEAEKFCTKIGFNQVKAVGQSSVLLSGSPVKPPCFFHNRLIMDTAGSGDMPPFLAFCSGATLSLNDFLAEVPADALSAADIFLNPAALWRWLQQTYPLPEQVGVTVQMYAGCPPQEFFDGLTGRWFAMILPSESTSGDSFSMADIYYEIPDKDARLFRIIAKFRMVDPDRESCVTLELGEDAPWPGMLFRKEEGKLICTSNAALPDKVRTMRRKGDTMLKNPAVKRSLRNIPSSAAAYSLENYRAMPATVGMAVPADEGFWSVSAAIIGRDGADLYFNDYIDWNGYAAKIVTAMLPGLARAVQAGVMKAQQCANGTSPAALQKEEDDYGKALQQLGKTLRPSPDGRAKTPAEPGRSGMREILRNIPENEADHDMILSSLVYFGVFPETPTQPGRTPLVFERPDCWIRQNFLILFADGRLESLTVPEDISSCEELISYLHTQYQYPEKTLQMFIERARLLDKELKKD